MSYEDVRALAAPILRHRILLNFHAESDRLTTDEIVRRLLEWKTTPRGVSWRELDMPAAIDKSIFGSTGASRDLRPGPGGENGGGWFFAGLHKSPDFGFSQEFAEYRAYTPGDDLRHVDWNVFARTERAYLKRYRGETNTASWCCWTPAPAWDSAPARVRSSSTRKFLASAIVYLAHLQRDSAGLIVFHDDVRNFIRPSARQGQLMRLLHGVDTAQLGKRTNFARPFFELQQF